MCNRNHYHVCLHQLTGGVSSCCRFSELLETANDGVDMSSILMNISPTRIKLRDLMRDKKKLILEHGDKPYLLSITRKGKLILTAADENEEPVKVSPKNTQ